MTLIQTFFPELYTDRYYNNSTRYNLVRLSDTQTLLEFNVVGISEKDVDVEVSGNKLTVSATTSDDRDYIYCGINTKPFKHSVKLRDDVVVKSASVKNGLLSVILEAQIPNEKKPRKIPIDY